MDSYPLWRRCITLLLLMVYSQQHLSLAFSSISSGTHHCPHRYNTSSIPTHPLQVIKNQTEESPSRRQLLFSASILLLQPFPSYALPNAIEEKGGTQRQRIQGIGGGFDLLSPPPLTFSDVYYPASMVNTKWRVQRVITSVEGDTGQAATMWSLLGGSNEFSLRLTEVYTVSFVEAPSMFQDGIYNYDGKNMRAAVMDRASSFSSRLGTSSKNIEWKKELPEQTVSYHNNKESITISTVQRKMEPPTEVGFGSDELLKVSSLGNSILGTSTTLDRAARIKTRCKRGYDDSTGKRIVDGIEIVMTYRVLDGVVGVEMPTSSCKSRIRWTEL